MVCKKYIPFRGVQIQIPLNLYPDPEAPGYQAAQGFDERIKEPLVPENILQDNKNEDNRKARGSFSLPKNYPGQSGSG